MEKIKNFILDKKHYIIGSFILIVVIITCLILFNKKDTVKAEEIVTEEKIIEEEKEACLVKIDIKGQVLNPGLYEMNCEDRVNDAIIKAGGLKDKADTSNINLSKKVFDQMVIVISSQEEIKKEKECVCDNKVEKEVKVEIPKENINNDADIKACVNSCINSSVISKDNKVSLNNATLEELMTLTGVGESKALNIIKYREEKNGFKKIEEIMNISGIGEKAFEKIKDNIKL